MLAKTRGKQFSIRSPKKGKTVDVYFDPSFTASVYVGSKYTTHYDLVCLHLKVFKLSFRNLIFVSIPGQ